ncbi:MAG: iron complex outermembrane receptor protein [Halioglobus sp.]|jgi:iron complex outermembrane receptor protein
MKPTSRIFQKSIAGTLSVITAMACSQLYSASAFAQLVLEEVVVTARKREESLQETPIAVSALSADTLEDLGLRDITDLREVVPNVDVSDGNGTSGAGSIFIRGIGARNTGVNFDSGVGLYVDNVYVSRPDGAVLDNLDLQSVQVLRGPQGTLFGKNTTGGAILYTTNKPVDIFEGHAEVRVGNYDRLDGKLTVNMPLIGDTLMSRFSVYSTSRDGLVTNDLTGTPIEGTALGDSLHGGEFDDISREGAQAQLRWVASDSLIFDLNYNYSDTDQSARGLNCEVVSGIDGAGWQAALQDDTVVIPSTGKSIAEWCQANADLGISKIQSDLAPRYEATVHSLSLVADWDINDTLAFRSITALRTTQGGETNDLDAIGIPILHRTNFGNSGGQLRETDQISQEFQLSGTAFGDKLDYIVGVFGFWEETDSGVSVSPSGPFFGSLSGFPAALTGQDCTTDNCAFYINQSTALYTENSSISVYSQADWNFNDQWRLTMGLRYTSEDRELQRIFKTPDFSGDVSNGATPIEIAGLGDLFKGQNFYYFPDGGSSYNPQHGFVPSLMDPLDPGSVDPLYDQTKKIENDDWTPMISLQRNFESSGFMDGGTAYITVANGFLSGGISDTTDIFTGELYAYEPEEVWNYEVGFKMDAWDSRLRVNTALFYTDYTERQLTTVTVNPTTGRIAGSTINAEKSSIAGLEIESILIPIPNMQIIANVTFNKGNIDVYDDTRIVTAGSLDNPGCLAPSFPPGIDVCPVDRSDEDLPRLPEEIYYLAVQYAWQTEIGTITPLITWSFRSNVENCFDQSSCQSGIYKGDQESLGARLTWSSPDENWRITAYGRNLTDERYVLGGVPLVDVLETAGTLYSLPRMYGVEAAFTW